MTAKLINPYSQISPKSAKKILLVEDNDVNRMLLSDYLTHCGYCIKSLPAGSGFLSTIKDFQPQVILLDLKLPDVDGYSLLKFLKQDPSHSCIPVIVISAFAFASDKEQAMKLGANHYMVKPVNLTELMTAIEQHLVH